MLWFLGLAAADGLSVASYDDGAAGWLSPDSEGKPGILNIILRPVAIFDGLRLPTLDDIADLHALAHRRCYLANSVKAEIEIDLEGQAAQIARPVDLTAPSES
jgi:organic hydroperoxide reductase OsmC/OhrA